MSCSSLAIDRMVRFTIRCSWQAQNKPEFSKHPKSTSQFLRDHQICCVGSGDSSPSALYGRLAVEARDSLPVLCRPSERISSCVDSCSSIFGIQLLMSCWLDAGEVCHNPRAQMRQFMTLVMQEPHLLETTSQQYSCI